MERMKDRVNPVPLTWNEGITKKSRFLINRYRDIDTDMDIIYVHT